MHSVTVHCIYPVTIKTLWLWEKERYSLFGLYMADATEWHFLANPNFINSQRLGHLVACPLHIEIC